MIKKVLVNMLDVLLPHQAGNSFYARFRRKVYLSRLKRIDILAWRVETAKSMGMKLGEGCRLFSLNVYSEPYLVELGNNVLVSGLVKFITHDGGVFIVKDLVKDIRGYYGRIRVGDNCFIGMDATILPNVEIGSNCIICAGAVVCKSIPDDSVVMGNPATVIFKTSLYLQMKMHSKNTITFESFPAPLEAPYDLLREHLEKSVPDIPRKNIT